MQRGPITKTGNAHLRRITIEAAWAYRHRPGWTSMKTGKTTSRRAQGNWQQMNRKQRRWRD